MSFSTASLRKVWDKFLDHLLGEADKERSLALSRLGDQLWEALNSSEQAAAGWTYPIDIFMGDDGNSLFSIVTQNGKLYQIPLTVSGETLSLGAWTQVTEVFEPVQQSKLVIRTQSDGSHRWLGVCATSVLNRVGEIDSSELFDSFVEHWTDTGENPRVDFYHMGGADPKAWEFGTADYLAREGCCYIASGLFDEDHPLAKAAIRAYNDDPPGTWGWSIEFYAHAEPEILVVEPKVQVPVYKRGKNTRISFVKEVDAAGLFTRVGITEEKTRMKRDIQDKLEELFGDDTEALAAFVENVDTVNRTIKDEKVIHRAKKDEPKETPAPAPDTDDDEDDEENDNPDAGNADEKDEDAPEIELDDEAVKQIAEQVASTDAFKAIQQSIQSLTETVNKLASAKEEDTKEIARLKKVAAKTAQRLETVEQDDVSKKQTWAEDLPRKQTIRASYRPRDEHGDSDLEDSDDLAKIAESNLRKLPSY